MTKDKKKDKKRKDKLETAEAEAAPQTTETSEPKPKMSRKEFEKEMEKLQVELVKMQEWVKASGAKVCVLFEGRDAAGKGGIIKRITERTSPRVFRVVALASPTEREKSQMYFQRYMPHLPAAGEVVIFDRSWYNRAGVERVMGFATEEQVEYFLKYAPAGRTGHHRTPASSWSSTGWKRPWRTRTERFRSAYQDYAQDLEAQPHGPGEPPPLVRLLPGARCDVCGHRHPRQRPGTWWIRNDQKRRARLNCIAHLLEPGPVRRGAAREGEAARSARPRATTWSRTTRSAWSRQCTKCEGEDDHGSTN